MKATRRNVFETNSSSSHSISLSDKDSIDFSDIKISEEDNVAHTWLGEFGWQIEDYSLCSDKLSYLVTMIAVQNELNPWCALEAECEEAINQIMELSDFAEIKACVCHELGVSDLVIDLSQGYIDHQSVYGSNLQEFLDESGADSIWDFIFGRVVVHTDNDNH